MSVLRKYNPTTEQWEILQGGVQGLQGPPVALSKGTVTTGAPGSEADFSITGTPPNQKLNLTIPRGATGATGAVSAWEYYAAGRPDIVGTLDAAALAWCNAAPSGSTFYSTDGPQGAWVWRKRGASWVCVEGDTGPRLIPLNSGGVDVYPTMTLVVQRVDGSVTATIREESSSPGPTGWVRVYTGIPLGLRGVRGAQLPLVDRVRGAPAAGILALDSASPFDTLFVRKQSESTAFQSITYFTDTAYWPITLPGTPA